MPPVEMDRLDPLAAQCVGAAVISHRRLATAGGANPARSDDTTDLAELIQGRLINGMANGSNHLPDAKVHQILANGSLVRRTRIREHTRKWSRG